MANGTTQIQPSGDVYQFPFFAGDGSVAHTVGVSPYVVADFVFFSTYSALLNIALPYIVDVWSMLLRPEQPFSPTLYATGRTNSGSIPLP